MATSVNLFVFGIILQITFVSPIAEIEADDEVLHLIGEPDFRDVRLRWEYGKTDEEDPKKILAFQIHYCELQAWGQYRCRTKVVDNFEDERSARMTLETTTSKVPVGKRGRTYTTYITGLRMATTYSFEVRPVKRDARDLADPHSIGSKIIIVPTKGFSARATQCLPHASEVEVSTGPYFGGRIAVEAADGGPERCSLQGNPNSAQDAYILRILHEECGSEVNDTTVATYVIVQENLPILTHSTRRFLVLCTYKPETLTVRAGINLPKANPGDVLVETKPHGVVEPYDEQELNDNSLQPARLEATKEESQQSMFGEITLVMFLVVAAFGGVAFLIWKMVPQDDKGNSDNVSISTVSSLSRTGIFRRGNIDRFNRSSIYSITLSEKDETVKKPSDGDDTSEA
ncbi:uncharacterized protein LOC113403939 [Vanessa tameamea]|uniref:Uncharacterized protein LOC113403939 n=1 Tax=Vanessa tameamea TaxID=334116 RepID=A0A8B8IV03_VANTA|nr:uncharacterized protein LOC113403939 [Vanessa tameamea]